MDEQTKTQQLKMWVTYSTNRYFNSTEADGYWNVTPPENQTSSNGYLIGIPLENRSYEIKGLHPSQGTYFTFNEINNQVTAALSTPSAKLQHWERDYYYDAATGKKLPFAQVTAPELHHRTEFVEFDQSDTTAALDGVQTAAQLKALLTGDGTTFHGAKGGYITFSTGEDSQYYWNPGSTQSYNGAAKFYLPNAYFDPFGAKTSYTYDPYHLLVTNVVHP